MTSYTTPTLVEGELRLTSQFSSSTFPSLLTVRQWIEEESKIVELETGQLFSSTVVSSEYLDYDGNGVLRLQNIPILSLTSVQYNIYSTGMVPSWVSLTEGFDKEFISDTELGEIEFIPGVNRTVKMTPTSGRKKFCVSYIHGFSTPPLEIQKLCTLQVTKRILMSLTSSQANTEGGEIQIGTIRITDPSNYSIGYLKSLNEEIKSLIQSIGQGWQNYRLNRVYE
jgi:hypothetical protein